MDEGTCSCSVNSPHRPRPGFQKVAGGGAARGADRISVGAASLGCVTHNISGRRVDS